MDKSNRDNDILAADNNLSIENIESDGLLEAPLSTDAVLTETVAVDNVSANEMLMDDTNIDF